MEISRKLIRDFMQDVMRSRLLFNTKLNRDFVIALFKEYSTPANMSLNDEIDFLNALQDFGENFVIFGEDYNGVRYIEFLTDPICHDDWERAMNSIYQERNHVERAYGFSLISTKEFHANLLLLAHAKDLYYALLEARVFVPSQKQKEIDNLLREINPNFDKRSEVTDIKKFAERVKNMREWQKEHTQNPSSDSERYCSCNEDLIDSIVAEILQDAQS